MSASISLTEFRQHLFQLADHVADTGEPLLILRNGVRLRLVRDAAPAIAEGRLARLVQQSAVIGAPLMPNESPAAWTGALDLKVAEPAASYVVKKPTRRTRRP